MQDIAQLIHAAWHRVQDRLQIDQHELAKRLGRRARPMLTRPPRAWCITLRASDRRLDRYSNSIELDARLLAQLYQPVHLSRDYLDEAAAKLGTTPVGLTAARIDGTITAFYMSLVGGRRGKPIPMLSTHDGIDPNANLFAKADPAWAWTAFTITARIPKNLKFTLTRESHFLSHVPKHFCDENRHPEIDAYPPPRKPRRLPPPDEDPCCWYKWSRAGHYLGNDPSNWRKRPDDLGLRPRRDLPRNTYKRKRRPSQFAGSLHFNGSFWRCPVCQKRCRKVYYPLPPINLIQENVPKIAKLVDIPQKIEGFACRQCHGVRHFTRLGSEAWNQLIAYLTQGLLYGREVERPTWFTPDRKRPYKPHFHPRPALRRQQVLDRLLQGKTRASIAAELRMSIPALTQQINKIYKSERRRGQRALLRKYGKPLPPHLIFKRDTILKHLRAGQLPDQIARALHIKQESVERYIRDLRRHGRLSARKTKRVKVADLHAAGLSRHEIAQQLNMTPQSVATRLCELRRTLAGAQMSV